MRPQHAGIVQRLRAWLLGPRASNPNDMELALAVRDLRWYRRTSFYNGDYSLYMTTHYSNDLIRQAAERLDAQGQ